MRREGCWGPQVQRLWEKATSATRSLLAPYGDGSPGLALPQGNMDVPQSLRPGSGATGGVGWGAVVRAQVGHLPSCPRRRELPKFGDEG